MVETNDDDDSSNLLFSPKYLHIERTERLNLRHLSSKFGEGMVQMYKISVCIGLLLLKNTVLPEPSVSLTCVNC